MSELRSPSALGRRAVAPVSVLATILASVLMAGCNAHTRASAEYAPSWPGEPARVAVAAPQKVEMEDDGQEAQLPPPGRVRNAPDDPSEPWSRNYGAGPVKRAEVPPAATPVQERPPGTRRQVASALPAD